MISDYVLLLAFWVLIIWICTFLLSIKDGSKMGNYEKAYKLYEKGGSSVVVDACYNGNLKYDKWGACEPCESKQPIYDDVCLVCGTIYINKKENEQ